MPIDDVFFECLSEQPGVCQEMLRVILQDPELFVKEVIPQRSERNPFGRSVRLDCLCILGDGSLVNIEIQRSDNDDHIRRTRFNAASITVHASEPGSRFADVAEVYVIYISQFDLFKEDKTLYHVDKILRETGTRIDDGEHIIFVNTAVNDGSDIAGLMSCMLQEEVTDERFPCLAAGIRTLKETEGGTTSMCKLMDKYIEEAKEPLLRQMEEDRRQMEMKDRQMEEDRRKIEELTAKLAALSC